MVILAKKEVEKFVLGEIKKIFPEKIKIISSSKSWKAKTGKTRLISPVGDFPLNQNLKTGEYNLQIQNKIYPDIYNLAKLKINYEDIWIEPECLIENSNTFLLKMYLEILEIENNFLTEKIKVNLEIKEKYKNNLQELEKTENQKKEILQKLTPKERKVLGL